MNLNQITIPALDFAQSAEFYLERAADALGDRLHRTLRLV